MNGQLLPSHYLETVVALHHGHDDVRDEPNLLEPLDVPLVLQCELEEDNLSNLMKCSVVFYHLRNINECRRTIIYGTRSQSSMLLLLMSCKLAQNNCEEVCMIIKEMIEQEFEMFCLLPIFVQFVNIAKAAGREGTNDAFLTDFILGYKNSLRGFEKLTVAEEMLNFLLDDKVTTSENI